MNVFDLYASLSLDKSQYDKGLSEAEKSGSSIGSRIGAGFAKVGKAVVAGIGVASTAVGALTAMSVKGYSDYEQLAGGVETLFKKSSQSVINNASKAYKTAGMSANEYMETVTGFSASLLQSLGGDTQKAAEKADTAIRDMSDNANKMGTDVESIQNAYQGFAKQNYTMLDNLKLGYGGTKEEMQRLLDDATKLSGVKYDISSFSDITEAIHVVQTELGITGTTAKEASATIQGSIQSMQGAWTNLITGLSDPGADLTSLINSFVDSVVTVGQNILPKIGVILNGIVLMIQQLAPKIIQILPGILSQLLPVAIQGAKELISAFVGVLPQLGKLVISVLPNILSGLKELFFGIIQALPSMVKMVAEALPKLIPQIVSAVVAMAVYLMKNIDKIIQPIINNLPEIIISVVDALITNLPILIDGVISLVIGLVKAIPKIILGIIEALPTIIEKIITGLIECIPQLIEGLIMLVIELVAHLPEIILGLIEAIPKIIVAVAKALVEAGPKIFEAFGRIFGGAWEKITEIFSGIVDWFKDIFEKLKMWAVSVYTKIIAWFKGIFEGLRNWALGIYIKITGFFQNIWNSITGVFSKVGEFFSNVFREAVDGVKGAFNGIKQWFSNLWQNIWNGIKTPINWIIDGINAVIDGLNSLKVDIPDWVPFVGGQTWGVNIPKIAKLAKGGFVEGGTPFIAGEAGAEAVIPLENNNQWIYKFAHAFADGLRSFYDGNNFTQTPTKGAGGKVVNINLYLDNVNVKNDDDIENVANKVSERIAEKLVAEGMAVG